MGGLKNHRKLITLIGCLAIVSPLSSYAQQPKQLLIHVGLLSNAPCPRCCGLDVHKATVVACVRLVIDGKAVKETRTFATTTAGLLALSVDTRRFHGNVRALGHDDYDGASIDGSVWGRGGDPIRRVVRGGSWNSDPQVLRSAWRSGLTPGLRYDGLGFRVGRTLTP